ncbi:hypothetical protein FB567DRAFT_218630 [Paraphoma chrysanthemicola]|uniref:Uncharacterized protein n=1 Tax=Paraphoma chrysanthemicola TaxID=798071 RepID=A0A8K0QTW5_9PLEO|nr:hypothetical protein FB567DRAFT_218630 [Paraphoma chrysanthemicola]
MQEVLMVRWRRAVLRSEAMGCLSAPTICKHDIWGRSRRLDLRLAGACCTAAIDMSIKPSCCIMTSGVAISRRETGRQIDIQCMGDEKYVTKSSGRLANGVTGAGHVTGNPHGHDKWRCEAGSFGDERPPQPPENAISQSQDEGVSVLPEVYPSIASPPPAVAEFLVCEAEASPTQERENFQMTIMQALRCQRIDLQTDCVAG